jgi:hypothetical protein
MQADLNDLVPDPSLPRRRLTDVRSLAHGYVWGLYLLLLGFVVPKVEAILRDFNIPLPRFTKLVFGASHLLSWPIPPLISIPVLLLILLGADWWLMDDDSKRGAEGWSLAWSMLMFALPWLLFAATIVALGIPFLTITWRLSG